MEYTIQVIIERSARFRKQLNELEQKRAQYESDVPDEIWKELVQVSRALDQEERKAQAAGRVKSRQVNDTRADIIETLEQYNHWREQMREVEQMFLTSIVRPGYRLKQAVRQREYLEGEYTRIRRGIEIESYVSLQELENEIRRVLIHGQAAFETDQESFEDEVLKEERFIKTPDQIELDDLVDEFEKDDLVREFKRVVLPSVHPDTSDTPGEVFKSVFEVYERRDYVLMEAYTVQYRGEIEPDPEEDPIEFLEGACDHQDRYERLLGRLRRRVEHMMKEITPQELEDPHRLRIEFQEQRDEINQRTRQESERILELREKIESLVQLYLDRRNGMGAEAREADDE